MAAYNKFQSFVEKQLISNIDWDADTFKVALSNTAPNSSTNTVFSDITEISAGNGYTAGGGTLTGVTVTRSGGTAKVSATDFTWTASGAVGPFRYVVFYKSTGTGSTSPLVSYWDYGSSITMASGDTFTVDFDGTNGIFQLT